MSEVYPVLVVVLVLCCLVQLCGINIQSPWAVAVLGAAAQLAIFGKLPLCGVVQRRWGLGAPQEEAPDGCQLVR